MGIDYREGMFQNVRVYWLAFIAYWGIMLFGYDTGGVVGNLYFEETFGLANSAGKINTKKDVDVSSNVVSVLQAGAFFGALISAPVSAKFGRKWPLIGFTLIFAVGAILTTIPSGNDGLSEIYAGRVISGFGIGAITAISPAFVAECSPKEVRGRITGMFQIATAFGVMISYFINLGVGLHYKNDPKIWRIPFGFQLVPAGIMALGLLTVKESPRYLVSVDRNKEALANLAYLRRYPPDSEPVIAEMAEIEAAIREERELRQGLGLREVFLGKGNTIRFVIAFVMFLLQQWSGQNSIIYYAPQIFASIGYTGTKNSLLASGVLGIVKVVTVTLFIAFGVETIGRRYSLFISALGMGILFFIVGAIFKTHPPPATSASNPSPTPSHASQAMAAMLYLEGCFYVIGWAPLPWVYISEIFPTKTRHYGSRYFVLTKQTPIMITELGYKLYMVFGSVNLGALTVFSLLIPETRGKSLEEMDIFGSVDAEQREKDITAVTHILVSRYAFDEEKESVVQDDLQNARARRISEGSTVR
ncbi:general substrate transporter [Gymnopus androsaceus JB14]|uniref:General substrate transporter n=1 Tax=Gymnopus androsaceus JB14 TaxID=1447944 RepID=A0A6A4HX06_9AGAR|nr:general substrate transporter [Gymnopus androsaceus JB14]